MDSQFYQGRNMRRTSKILRNKSSLLKNIFLQEYNCLVKCVEYTNAIWGRENGCLFIRGCDNANGPLNE